MARICLTHNTTGNTGERETPRKERGGGGGGKKWRQRRNRARTPEGKRENKKMEKRKRASYAVRGATITCILQDD